MKLLGSPTSPYVRKCRVTIAELGLGGKVDFVVAAPTSDELRAANPIFKVPALVLDNGESVFDSRMIMRYLNEQAGGKLYPAGDWSMVRRESQAEGLIDALLLLRMETFARPEEFRWDGWIATQTEKVNSVLDTAEAEAGALGDEANAAAIGMACGLGYLDFRFADWGWRNGRPGLAKWFEGFSARASMQGSTHE
jgi:glutathione S-transferase